MTRPVASILAGWTLSIGVIGCAPGPCPIADPSQRDAMALLMASRIEIVEPFTRVKSFDHDDTPDGIELLIQAVNALDNAGLMIAGQVGAELFEYVAASADHQGRRLEQWSIELTTEEQQRTYWNAMTQMYEFRLAIDPARIPPAEKYVLAVTYGTPLGERLTDQCIISYQESWLRTTRGRGTE